MGKEQDLEIAKKRAKNGDKSLFWYGYALALEGYSSTDVSRLHADPCLRDRIKPSGNQNKYEIESSIEKAEWTTSADSFLWIGFAAALEGLNLAEAKNRLVTDPRHHLEGRSYKPWDGEKVRNGLWSFIIAFAVSCVLNNILAIIWCSVMWLVNNNASGVGTFNTVHDYIATVIFAIILETLIFKTMYFAYLCARKYHSLKYVLLKGMFGGKIYAGTGNTTVYLRM
jgi:hypothetical protein